MFLKWKERFVIPSEGPRWSRNILACHCRNTAQPSPCYPHSVKGNLSDHHVEEQRGSSLPLWDLFTQDACECTQRWSVFWGRRLDAAFGAPFTRGTYAALISFRLKPSMAGDKVQWTSKVPSGFYTVRPTRPSHDIFLISPHSKVNQFKQEVNKWKVLFLFLFCCSHTFWCPHTNIIHSQSKVWTHLLI